MIKSSFVTDAKIKWLSKHGYVEEQIVDGKTSYIITEKGQVYLNDEKE